MVEIDSGLFARRPWCWADAVTPNFLPPHSSTFPYKSRNGFGFVRMALTKRGLGLPSIELTLNADWERPDMFNRFPMTR
jgi:hypothetical protein